MLFFWDKCAGTLLCEKNPITIFSAYTRVLQMWVKMKTYQSQMTITWFTKHMGNNAYDTQNISISVTTHMIHNNHYIMLIFTSFTI